MLKKKNNPDETGKQTYGETPVKAATSNVKAINKMKKEIEAGPFKSPVPQLNGKGMETLEARARALVGVQEIWNRKNDGEFPGPMQVVCRGARDWLKKRG